MSLFCANTLLEIRRRRNVIGQPQSSPNFQSRTVAIFLGLTRMRYLRWSLLSITYLQSTVMECPPSTNDRGRKLRA